MPDIPVEIEGNSIRFTISTRATHDPQTAGTAEEGDKIGLDGGGKALRMRLATDKGVELTAFLGDLWKITIEQVPDLTPKVTEPAPN